jgi:hypothetical protein
VEIRKRLAGKEWQLAPADKLQIQELMYVQVWVDKEGDGEKNRVV